MDTQQPAASVLPPALADLTEQVWAEARKAVRHGSAGGNSTQGFWDNLQGFLHAVDWQERWLQGILAAHVCLFGLVLACRRNTAVLSGVFLLLGACVYFGERVNGLAQQHWQAFATQDYFDEHGVFYNAVVSGPALVTLFTVLVFYLREAANLMVLVKTKELKQRARERAQAERAEGKKAQ